MVPIATFIKMQVAQVRHNLAQLTIAITKDPLTVAVAAAKYQESLLTLRKLSVHHFLKDNEGKALIERMIDKQLDQAEMDVFLSDDEAKDEPQTSKKGETDGR